MCGIVGYLGPDDAAAIVLDGLRRLEYRGYDSAGIAVARNGVLGVAKSAGQVNTLAGCVDRLAGAGIAIGHTRWATHGAATDANAHPHTDGTGRIAIVHNGIIENADELRERLDRRGVRLASQTDSEVLAHLIGLAVADGSTLPEAVRHTMRLIRGTYGLLVLDAESPAELVAARDGSPLVVGVTGHEMFVASDVPALAPHTDQVIYLRDGELAVVRPGQCRTTLCRTGSSDALATAPLTTAQRMPTKVDLSVDDYELNGFPDFMAKEIREQPTAVSRVLHGRLDEHRGTALLDDLAVDPATLPWVRRVTFLGCGSAYYAAQLGAGLVEELARMRADAEPAAEFRHRNPVVDRDTLYVAVSQSGETYDTLAAVHELRRRGCSVVYVANVEGSAIARACDSGVYLRSGPEISVASTKAFTNMAVTFAMLGLMLGRQRELPVAEGRRIVAALRELPAKIGSIVDATESIAAIADRYADARSMFYIGRVRAWPAAREGAQKLKEISYVHAEAYQASELKHGPLALIDPTMPSVVLVPRDELLAKNLSTIEQIKARGGPVIAVTTSTEPIALADEVIRVPGSEPELEPILLTVPLQLFAYHVARKLGHDVDKPRNLAKSVTVE